MRFSAGCIAGDSCIAAGSLPSVDGDDDRKAQARWRRGMEARWEIRASNPEALTPVVVGVVEISKKGVVTATTWRVSMRRHPRVPCQSWDSRAAHR